MKKTRIGIIGVGTIGEQHLITYAMDNRVEVVAACDINPDRLAAMCDKYGIPNRYDHIGRFLDRDDLDAVDVCLHNHLHAPVSIEVMRRGRNAYCEKPMAGTFADARDMYDASRTYGRMLHIQLAFLYQLETRVAKRQCRNAYCEKPMAGTFADARDMYDASRTYGRMLHIQLAFLYQLETRVAKRFIDAGDLGLSLIH